jgi:hypothetical protein
MSMHRMVQQVVRGLVPIIGFAAAVSFGGRVMPEPAGPAPADSAAPRESAREHLLAVAPGLSPNALDLALRARARAIQQGMTRSPILTVIDYSLPSTVKRLWVLDVERPALLFHELVAHGKGTGDNLARSFSNRDGSNASSLGAFLTGPTYFGKHGLSLRLRGLEAGFNDRAERRGIVVHGATYVSDAVARALGRLGRSQGCPAVREEISSEIIRTIKDGTLLFSYFPEPRWLGTSPFLKHG